MAARAGLLALAAVAAMSRLALAFRPAAAPLLLRSSTAARPHRRISMPFVVRMAATLAEVDASPYLAFLKDKAQAPNPPRRLSTLLQLLAYRGMELCNPADRRGLNPFVVPLATDTDGTKVGLLRWPTAPEHLPMPLVRSSSGDSPSSGLELLATDVDYYIKRVASEEDFRETPGAADVIALANAGLWDNQEPYVAGSVKKLGYGLERYQMLKVAPFPDVYKWLVNTHLGKGDELSALSTAEKFNEVFPGWGHPYAFYAQVLAGMKGRDAEARDAAKVALRCPCWTITRDADELRTVCGIAGYSDMAEAKALYRKLAEDPQDGKKTEGKAPAQIALDRAAHMMDAVIFGHQDWDSVRDGLAAMYEEAGIPELAQFVKL